MQGFLFRRASPVHHEIRERRQIKPRKRTVSCPMVEPKLGPIRAGVGSSESRLLTEEGGEPTNLVAAGEGEVRDSLGMQRVVDRDTSFERLGELLSSLR
jgi:hypothetical protein